jgi:protein-tyrosine phosphatase
MKTYYYGHSLYTRGKPLPAHVGWLRRHNFLVVSLSPAYPEHLRELGEKSIHIPLPDGRLTPTVIDDVMRAKEHVVDYAKERQPVLTHCNAGRNRAALVIGLAYADLAEVSGNVALTHVRMIRPNSLANEHFAKFLQQYRPYRSFAALHQMGLIRPTSDA